MVKKITLNDASIYALEILKSNAELFEMTLGDCECSESSEHGCCICGTDEAIAKLKKALGK